MRMSLGIAFKGPEGVVMAADSRVTLMQQLPNNTLLPAHFDNATKLLKVGGQNFVGVVTYGQGALGTLEPRTAHSYMPEFEAEVNAVGVGRLSVQDFTQRLSDFFVDRWNGANMPQGADPMFFLVGGFDEGTNYGRLFQVSIPDSPAPIEQAANEFGISMGGQTEYVGRLLGGFDGRLPGIVRAALGLDQQQETTMVQEIRKQLNTAIPYQFLPLQDCVDLAIFLIRTTVAIQSFTVGLRGVGGSIDVATITRMEGYQAIQAKRVVGER